MKNKKGLIILCIVVVYFGFMAFKNIHAEKDENSKIVDDVIVVEDGKINEDNENKLVLVSGKISYDGKISFDEVDDEFDSFKVTRIVEDYTKKTTSSGNEYNEWVERESSIDNTTLLNSLYTETKTLDTYVGEFKLDSIGMDKVNNNELYINKDIKIDNLEFDGLAYSNIAHKENEVVGDVRIKYYYYNTNNNKYISILARQVGDSFEEYEIDNNKVYYVFDGKVDSKEKLKKELNANTNTNIRGKVIFILIIVIVGVFLIVDNKKKV